MERFRSDRQDVKTGAEADASLESIGSLGRELDGPGVELFVRFVEFQVAVRAWGDAMDRSTEAVQSGSLRAKELLDLEAIAWERQLVAAAHLREATDQYREMMRGTRVHSEARNAVRHQGRQASA